MKTVPLVVVIAAAVWAADFTRAAEQSGGLAERFKQLDRNGDGKLTVEELGSEWLGKLDTSGDGYATLEEATGYFRNPPQAPATAPRPDFSGAWVVSSLAKPSLEVCLSASDAEQATKFFAEGLGLAARGEPRGGTKGAPMRMLLFGAGSSNVKVRVYQQTPERLPADIAARNGLRVLTIPVEKLDDVVARLKRLGFEVTDAKQAGTTRWALARNADGTAFELVETQPGAAGGASHPVTGEEPELHPPSDRAFLDFEFTTDYFAARQPADSALAKPTEAFCGFDQTGARGAGATGPATWICKATLPIENNASQSTQATTQEKP